MPDWKKFIEAKIALAERGAKPSKASENFRIPAGQSLTTKFPVLDLGIVPAIKSADWQLRIYGMVKTELNLNWADFLAFPQIEDTSDFHCVTRWSQLDMNWQGVQLQQLLMQALPLPNAKFATIYGYDGYTTNLPIDALLDDEVLIAHSVLGAPLTAEHGGPARMVVPKRYAWKGAKWVKAIELHEFDRPGFWEVRGYHNDADPWLEQRFSSDN